ncbi:MAG: class I SAM-dependent methyltransferase [Verrucomicrobia bacterium]|nr:class I SAM-dependent methyltransferase [Verrucomicrobiota bacterium]MBU1735457.1 class I SAM-dependent methyltransferase [Verrucomicrobiota bacterium]MBU1856852.1 class I SAM-dependent methyltransferase [Verrucomicrobiota bacterium]
MPAVSLEDFALSFGIPMDSLAGDCRQMVKSADFSYSVIQNAARDALILDVLKRIDADNQQIGAEARRGVWEKGWSENLNRFRESGYNLNALRPKFIRADLPVRYAGNYIRPNNPDFEYDYMTVFRTWLFREYLKDCDRVYEFGCGTGLNLVLLASLFPNMELHGLDFVPSSVDLVNEVGRSKKQEIFGHLFDMIHPDRSFQLKKNCAVFTFGAIEQLAGKFEAFLQYLMANRPAICFHIEPTIELYDENLLFDYLAIKFHRKRGYTEGLLPRLQELASKGIIELIKVKRLYFGSLFMEGYSYFVWRMK